jgi:Nuclease A inhibitor-like protein
MSVHRDSVSVSADSTLRARLAATFAVAARGLPNVFDESTDFLHGFSAVLPADQALSPATFKSALSVSSGFHIDFRAGQDFFDATRESDEPQRSGYQLVETLMQATLSDLTVAFARRDGVVRVRMWLFGRTADGDLVGLKSESTET